MNLRYSHLQVLWKGPIETEKQINFINFSYMHFSLETLTYISIFLIGGVFVVANLEKEIRQEIRDLKDRINSLEHDK